MIDSWKEMAVLTVTRLGAANTKVAVGFMIGVCTMVTHHTPSVEAWPLKKNARRVVVTVDKEDLDKYEFYWKTLIFEIYHNI